MSCNVSFITGHKFLVTQKFRQCDLFQEPHHECRHGENRWPGSSRISFQAGIMRTEAVGEGVVRNVRVLPQGCEVC